MTVKLQHRNFLSYTRAFSLRVITGLSLGDKNCIKNSGHEQGERNCTGICNAELSCLRDKEEGFVPVDTSPPSCTSAISCHHQLGANQHTSTLTAQGKIALFIHGCSFAQERRQKKKKKNNNPFIILISPHFHFFFFFFHCSVLMLCFPALGKKKPKKQAVCVFTVEPLQQPHLVVDIVAILQPALSSSRWWSWRVISPTQRLLRRETWEVCACQSKPCGDDSVRHLK